MPRGYTEITAYQTSDGAVHFSAEKAEERAQDLCLNEADRLLMAYLNRKPNAIHLPKAAMRIEVVEFAAWVLAQQP